QPTSTADAAASDHRYACGHGANNGHATAMNGHATTRGAPLPTASATRFNASRAPATGDAANVRQSAEPTIAIAVRRTVSGSHATLRTVRSRAPRRARASVTPVK